MNHATWEQRYYSNDEFFQAGGPIFVFLSGDRDITPYRLTTSLMTEMAAELNGHIFNLEHRFYGQSRPTNDTSNASLRFLSTEQALADVAHFISHITSEDVTPGASNSSVIVIGEHYSASLAVWVRQKYPHLCIGAWASSAPLQALVNFQQFKELAGAVYRSAASECYSTIERGFADMEQYLLDGRADEIDKIFNTCDPITTPADVAFFFNLVSEFFSFIPQFGNISSVRGVCDLITNGTDSEMHRLALYVNNVIGSECLPNSYDYLVESDRIIDWDHPINAMGFRQFSYQRCTQFGWYHSSDSRFQPFGSSFGSHWFYIVCQDVFGEEFTQVAIDENVNRFNTVYGGLDPTVTNTIFVHGELDPWRSIGRQTSLNPTSPALIIRGAYQGNDLGPMTDEDSPQLIAAKRTIMETIRQWVRDA